MRVVINTPGGNIGRRVVNGLLEKGVEVVGISRNPEKVKELVDKGMKLIEGSADDKATLEKALEGADALFWLTPPLNRPDYTEWAISMGKQAAETAKAKGIARAVVLSSVGAQNGRGLGPVSPMQEIENAFLASVPHVTILRPGFFMENLFQSVNTIAKMGTIFMPVPSNVKYPMVSTGDIGDKAVEVFLDPAWKEQRVVGVHGPEDISYEEAAKMLSEALERTVNFVQVSLDQAREAMSSMGLPAFMVDGFAELYKAIGDGRMNSAEPRSAESTTPTSLKEFGRKVLKPAVDHAASAQT